MMLCASRKQRLWFFLVVLGLCAVSGLQGLAQDKVQPIAPPRQPLPPEVQSAGVTRFSFIVYSDTRGRRDGAEVQYEHSLVVDGILSAIRRLEKTDYPVRFVLQSGDAVDNGREPKQWNVSFVGLANRLTTEGGVPYFLAPGNHDVTAATQPDAPQRKEGLANYLAAIANLIPPDGDPRRLAGYPTFAFGYGNTFVLALDSNIASDDRQYEWVKGQLEAWTANATGTWPPSFTIRPSPPVRTAARKSSRPQQRCGSGTCRCFERTT